MPTTSLSSLAAEFKLVLVDFLDVDDKGGKQALLDPSQTSRPFRELCAPKLFRSITIDDDQERAGAIEAFPTARMRDTLKHCVS